MTMTPDEARAKVDVAREAYGAKREEAVVNLEKAVEEGLEDLVQRFIEDQPDVVASLAPEDLAILKFNVGEASKRATTGVRGVVMELDLDALSRKARKGTSGTTMVSLFRELTDCVKPVPFLFRNVGFSLSKGRRSRSSLDRNDFLADLSTSGAISVNERVLDRAVEEYGIAKIDLNEAEFAVKSSNAKSTWDNA